MLQLLEKYKNLFQLFSFLPLAHMLAMLVAGEMYRRKYSREAFIEMTQEPVVVLLGLAIAVAGMSTWILLLVHAFKSKQFHTPLKVIWLGNLVLFGVFAMPVYFFRFVLNPPAEINRQAEVFQALLWTGIFFVTSGILFVYQVQNIGPYLGEEELLDEI